MREVIVRSKEGKFAQDITVGDHRILADEEKSAGGDDSGAGPHELLLAALGACTSMTLRMYAERKGWALRSVQVNLTGETVDGKFTIARHLTLDGDLDAEQRLRLSDIAAKCPVHRTLTRGAVVNTTEGGVLSAAQHMVDRA